LRRGPARRTTFRWRTPASPTRRPRRRVGVRAVGARLADAGIKKVGHDLKFATIALGRRPRARRRGHHTGRELPGHATRSSHDPPGLAIERATYRAMSDEDVVGRGVKAVRRRGPAAIARRTWKRADPPLGLAPGFARSEQPASRRSTAPSAR
jgi:hypothetical protein